MFQSERFDFLNMNSSEIQQVLRSYNLAIKPEEAIKIQSLLQRPPTLAECILWGIQGSEHCSYKSSRILLKTLPTSGPNVISGAKEDAGIIAIATDAQNQRWGLAISHESHNHPSQIVPFEGAATGIGGNVRDVCCMGAEVIANADSLRFGDFNYPKARWIQQGAVSGIASYSNAIGVPNIAGDIEFDPAYNDNCLVTVVSLGIVKESAVIHSYVPKGGENYEFILVGKPTDNSGFGGASFASIDLNENDQVQNRGAVQEPNAFLGRVLMKSHYALFKKLEERGLISKVGFKDLGAGGIACASVELAEAGGYGAEIDLDSVPTSIQNLNPAIILCAETQERYLWAVPPDLTPMILQHYNSEYALPQVSEGACAKVIGTVRPDGIYRVRYKGETLIDAKAHDITQGIVYDRPAQAPSPKNTDSQEVISASPIETLTSLLALPAIASREPIFEQYDKQVQGRVVIERGHADAGVIAPFNSKDYPREIRTTGLALSLAANPRMGKISPYWTAVNAVAQAMLSVASVGAEPAAITDCLCFGNPEKPEQMWELKESIRGIKDACEGISLKQHKKSPTPVVAGNVSLYNDSARGAIPASPMISCVGVMANVERAITQHLKQNNSHLLMISGPRKTLGSSVWDNVYKAQKSEHPKTDLNLTARSIYAITDAIHHELILSAKTIGAGGLLTTLAIMSFHNEIGLNLNIDPTAEMLFGEDLGLIIEVAPDKLKALQSLFIQYDLPYTVIGETNSHHELALNQDSPIAIQTLKSIWQQGLRRTPSQDKPIHEVTEIPA